MTITLPEQKVFGQFGRLENAWSDHYGALAVAATYAGMHQPERYYIRGMWQHGCAGPWLADMPEMLCDNIPNAQSLPLYVARADQAELLIRHGFPHARAIGLPFVYLPEIRVARIPRSLLVVPTHTLVGDGFDDRTDFDKYAEEIRQVAGSFSRVLVCVHPNCRLNGLWLKEFTSRGFEIVYGAQTNDANALLRMQMLFSQFETMTTNGWGSHVAYALASGARVSIHGTEPVRRKEHYLRDTAWEKNPTVLDRLLSMETKARERAYLATYSVPPAQAVQDQAAGRWLIGAGHRLPPEEMAILLKNFIDPPPRLVDSKPSVFSEKPGSGLRQRVLFVTPEATRTGAPMFLLHFLRWLRKETRVNFEILLGAGGPLEEEFRKLGLVHTPTEFGQQSDAKTRFSLVYSNTSCNSHLIQRLGLDTLPLITHVHELDMAYHWLGARKMATIIRQSVRLVACAGVVAERLTGLFGLPRERIAIHHAMIDLPAVKAAAAATSAEEVRRAHGIPNNALVVLACGTVEFRTAPDLFVQLATRVGRARANGRPVRFLWVGAFKDEDLMRALREDMRKLGVTQEIQFVGELPDPHGLLALADVFCLTSREDPFPLIMLEAAALGKPVVGFAGAGGVGEFSALGGGVTVPYLDVGAMAATCGDLLDDPERARQIGARAAEAVSARFTLEAIAPGLWRELEQVMAGCGQASLRKQSLAEIYQAWRIDEAPQPAQVKAQLVRSKARLKAARLMESGQGREAAALLVQAVTADFATKIPEIICESLLEIAQDLAPLDTKQATVLADRAAVMARSSYLQIDFLRPWPATTKRPIDSSGATATVRSQSTTSLVC